MPSSVVSFRQSGVGAGWSRDGSHRLLRKERLGKLGTEGTQAWNRVGAMTWCVGVMTSAVRHRKEQENPVNPAGVLVVYQLSKTTS